MQLVEVKPALNIQNVSQQLNARNGKTERTEEFISKVNNSIRF